MVRRATIVGALSLLVLTTTRCSSTGQQSSAPGPTEATQEGPPIQLPITRNDLPRTGLCRIWVANAEQVGQSKDFSCRNIEYSAPLGSYVFFRSRKDREEVFLCYMSRSESGVIDGIDVFSYSTLRLRRVVLQRRLRTTEDTMKCMDAEGADEG